MRLIFLPIVVFIILAVTLLSQNLFPKNTLESTIANWNDGTDAFYQQVLKSDGDWVDHAGEAVFDNYPVKSISKLETENILAQARQPQPPVLGLHTAPDGAEKWIEIDLSNLKLYAWEGNRKVYEFLISTGRPGYNTPTGEFRVWRKVLSQAYKGGSRERGDYYYLPNVPFSLFFGGGNVSNWKGYAIHGAYWHSDFGIKNRSSGCVNVKPEEAGLLYQWAGPAMPAGTGVLNSTPDNPGVRVIVHD
ncbi:L,D-transpeptidase [Candidatus Daviesbacteria bacterium]|nr:L,D-transpeptidase [Candidatus Daviesbacteria bacterium]